MTFQWKGFYFRAWRPPCRGFEITFQYTPPYKGEGHKTSLKLIETRKKNEGIQEEGSSIR